MVVTCDIEFENNPEGCYYAGQVMSGKVTLSADKIKQVKAVTLKIKGFAHNSWSEKDSSDNSTRFTGHVDYIDTLTYLLRSADSEEFIQINPGIHCFNYVCHIPTNCPSSFEGTYGHIRYMVQVSFVRPWKFDTKFTKGLTVLKIMDLNCDSPLLRMPISNHMSKIFCCGPLKSDPLEMVVQLPRSGFVPGECIPVKVLVTNETKAKIKEVRLRLVMVACLHSQSPRVRAKNETTTVTKLVGDPVLPLCKKEFSYLLPVPATPPTCLNTCSITQISYRIEVEAKIKGALYANQEIQTPVTIGNVPLSNVIEVQPSLSRARMLKYDGEDQIDSAVVTEDSGHSNVQPWSENSNTPPPLYMEATFMPQALLASGEEHEYGEGKYSPKYPVFNMLSASTETPISENEVSSSASETNKSTWL